MPLAGFEKIIWPRYFIVIAPATGNAEIIPVVAPGASLATTEFEQPPPDELQSWNDDVS